MLELVATRRTSRQWTRPSADAKLGVLELPEPLEDANGAVANATYGYAEAAEPFCRAHGAGTPEAGACAARVSGVFAMLRGDLARVLLS